MGLSALNLWFRHAYQQENRYRREEIKMNVFGRLSEIAASHSLPLSYLKRSKATSIFSPANLSWNFHEGMEKRV